MYPVGIYLGPNDSSIAGWKNGKPEIIPTYDYLDSFTIPSVVSFIKNDIIVGTNAEYNKTRNPKNIIYGIGEIIGKKYGDPDVQIFIKNVPVKIEKDSETDKPKIIVEFGNKIKSYYPE